jgi:hypothetical protein
MKESASANTVCAYTKTGSDGYGTDWKTNCGRTLRCEAPIDVGFSSAPLPNEDGEYCHFCGKKIKISKP